MGKVSVRVYAELGDLVPPPARGCDFVVEFAPGRTIKDLVEGLGIPHTEVDLILVNGEPVGFAHILAEGERISVYPMFEAFDLSGVTQVRAKPLRQPRFIADVHLGRLAAYLRLAGFDTLYQPDWRDEEIVNIALEQNRAILTRDRGLLKRAIVTHGYLVRETVPLLQLGEVLHRFDLAAALAPFSRCSVCNAPIEPVPAGEIRGQLPPRVAESQREFWRCRGCQRLYWKGSHYQAIMNLLAAAVGGDRESPGGIAAASTGAGTAGEEA